MNWSNSERNKSKIIPVPEDSEIMTTTAQHIQPLGSKDPDAKALHNVLKFDVSYSVKTKKSEKFILRDVSDVVTSGQTLAILGPSGAGKTSLMRMLTMDAFGGSAKGSITFNGKDLSRHLFTKKFGVVAQEDFHWAFLTTRETIAISADLYLNLSAAEKKAEVERIIHRMGLESCADTIIGNTFIHGLSGGQKRRLSLAITILKKLEVVLLDEPTSGLDAASSAGIMSFIADLTKKENLIMIFTIHQPSTAIYDSFDRVMLLSRGRIAYCGSRVDVLDYFNKIGCPVPPQTNPAEFMLDLVNADFSDENKVTEVLDKWHDVGEADKAERGKALCNDCALETDAHDEGSLYAVGLLTQIMVMFKRHGLLLFRDPTLYLGRMIAFQITTLFFGIVYIVAREKSQENVVSRMWFVIWCCGVPSNMGVASVFIYNQEYFAVRREVKNGMVSPIAYLFANAILQIPMMFLLSLFAIGIGCYGLLDFDGDKFGQVLLVYGTTLYAFEAIAQMLAVSFDNPLLGMLNFMQVWFAAFLFSGLFLAVTDIVWPFQLFSYILPYRYTFRSIVYQEFIDQTFSGASLCVPGSPGCNSYPGETTGYLCTDTEEACYGRTGEQVLESIGQVFDIFSADDNFALDTLIIVAIAVVSKILYMVLMMVKADKTSTIEPK